MSLSEHSEHFITHVKIAPHIFGGIDIQINPSWCNHSAGSYKEIHIIARGLLFF